MTDCNVANISCIRTSPRAMEGPDSTPRLCENARRLTASFFALRFCRLHSILFYSSFRMRNFETIESMRIVLGVFKQPRPEADICPYSYKPGIRITGDLLVATVLPD